MGKRRFSQEQEQEMIKLYEAGQSYSQIADVYHCDKTTIGDIMKRNRIIARQARFQKKYTCNESFFDEIDCEKKAYYLGLLYADGCNLLDRNQICLELQATDKDILEQFNSDVENTRPIYNYAHPGKGQDTAKLTLCSKYMCESLQKIGCVPRKSLILQFPELPDELLRHFIRGYYDGDGGITVYKGDVFAWGSISIVGSNDFITSLSKVLECNIQDIHFIIRDWRKCKSLIIYRKKSVLDFLDWLYKDSQVKLQRKFLKYQELFQYKQII